MGEDTAIEVRMDHVETRLDKHEDVHRDHLARHDKLWKAIDAVGKRPPAWVSAVIGALGVIIGWLTHMALS